MPKASPSDASSSKRGSQDTPSVDPDTFPHADSATQSRQAKRARTLNRAFNERENGGPRDLNGAVRRMMASERARHGLTAALESAFAGTQMA